MQEPVPSLLAHLDWTAIIWAAVWAFAFSLPKIGRLRRRQQRQSTLLMPWWWAIVDVLLGSVVGGILFALVIPERFPDMRRPGYQALLAVAGSVLAPFLADWIQQAFRQVVAFISERRFGVRIELKDPATRKRAKLPVKDGDSDES